MTTRSGRTQPCDRTQARTRLDNAEKSLEVAELATGEQEIPASRSVAAALAVLSGIASATPPAAPRSAAARAETIIVNPQLCCGRSSRQETEPPRP